MGIWLFAMATAAAALWAALRIRAARALAGLPILSRAEPPEPARWPRLSLIVAACDEEETLERAAGTLLSQDYPDLEIVLVDDRSRDRTREVMREAAARDPRVVIVHVDSLPPGWLGKVHALARGARAATGQWLLLCDADVHLGPGCLRRAIAAATARGIDHMPVLPRIPARGLVLPATYCAFGMAYLATLRADALADPRSGAYAGVGAFNLVREGALARGGGFEEIRMEVADDVGVGYLARRGGGRAALALAGEDVSVEWYPSLGAMARGLEKNLFGVIGHYRLPRALARTALYAVTSAAPLFVLATAGAAVAGAGPAAEHAGLAAAAAAGVVGSAAFAAARVCRLGQRPAAALLEPVGALVLCAMIVRSSVVTWWRGGIEWRGTFYPLSALRAGQRVKV